MEGWNRDNRLCFILADGQEVLIEHTAALAAAFVIAPEPLAGWRLLSLSGRSRKAASGSAWRWLEAELEDAESETVRLRSVAELVETGDSAASGSC